MRFFIGYGIIKKKEIHVNLEAQTVTTGKKVYDFELDHFVVIVYLTD